MNRCPSTKLLALAFAAAAVVVLTACEKTPSPEQKAEAAPTAPAPSEAAQPASPAPSAPAASAEQAPFLQAVTTYLEQVKNLNTAMMNIELKDLKVEGTKATATVIYTAKKGEMPPMVYGYEFAQENGTWKAVSSTPQGGPGHGGMAMPPGEGMPPGHPPVDMPAHGATPEGHPPVSPTPAK